jgi:hypothetical protein
MSKLIQLKRKATTTSSSSNKKAKSLASFTYWNQEFKLQQRVAYRESSDSPWMGATIVNVLYDGVVTLNIHQQDSQYFNSTIQTAVPLLASMDFFAWSNGRLSPSTHHFKPEQVWEVQEQGNCVVERVEHSSITLRNGDRTIVLRGSDILDKMQRLISSPDGAEIKQDEPTRDQTTEIKEELWRWYTEYKSTGGFVAIKDKEGHWYQGRIVNLNETVGAVQVHYEGFPQSSDEWVRAWDHVSVFYEEHFEPLKRKNAEPGDLQVKIRHRKFYNKELKSVLDWWDKFDKCCMCNGFQHTYLSKANNQVYCDSCRLKLCCILNCYQPAVPYTSLCRQHIDEGDSEGWRDLETEIKQDPDHAEEEDAQMEEAEQELKQEQVNQEEDKSKLRPCATCNKEAKVLLHQGKYYCIDCGVPSPSKYFDQYVADGNRVRRFCEVCNTDKYDRFKYKPSKRSSMYRWICAACDEEETTEQGVLIKPNLTTTTTSSSSSQPKEDLNYGYICNRCPSSNRYVKAYTTEGVYWSLCHACYVAAIQKKTQFFKVIYEPQEDLPTATQSIMEFYEFSSGDKLNTFDLVQVTTVYRVRQVLRNHAVLEDIETKAYSTQPMAPLVKCNRVNLKHDFKDTVYQSRTQLVNLMLSLSNDLFMIHWTKRLDLNELKKKSNCDPEAFGTLAMNGHETRTVIARLWPRKTQSPMPFGQTLIEYVWDMDEDQQIECDDPEPRLVNNEGIQWILHDGTKYVAR